MDGPTWVWALTVAGIPAKLVYDFAAYTREAHVPAMPREETGLMAQLAEAQRRHTSRETGAIGQA